MKKISKRLFGAMLAIIMVVTMLPNGIFKASATAATAQSGYAIGDIITYGSYPQTKIIDSGLVSILNSKLIQWDRTVTYEGVKYKKMYFTQYTPWNATDPPSLTEGLQKSNGYFINTDYWFKFEPIQWRVLSSDNGQLFVLSEKILNSRQYNDTFSPTTWEYCSVRSWLNNNFYNDAFSVEERSKIIPTLVVNENNPYYGTECGNNTTDNLFLLSYSEVTNTNYGFSSNNNNRDSNRIAEGTDYAKSNNLWVSYYNPLGKSYWWLRTQGRNESTAGTVYPGGDAWDGNNYNNNTYVGIRPALKLNLSLGIPTSPNLNESFTYDNQVYSKNLALKGAIYCGAYDKKWCDEKGKTITINRILEDDGYGDIEKYAANEDNLDGAGFTFAHKVVNNGEHLFTVVIQGTVGAEWQGNMDLTGNSYNASQKDHSSFSAATAIIKAKLLSYLNEPKYNGKKLLFITGFSRGAAVGNLLAKDMTDNALSEGISKVYSYNFATPNVSKNATTTSYPDQTNYKNIYNFCFRDDFVAQSPMWGYGKYGITSWATAQDLYSNKAIPNFKNNMDYMGTTDFNKKATGDIISYLSGICGSTDSYYNYIFWGTPWLTIHDYLKNYLAPAIMSNFNVPKCLSASGNGNFYQVNNYFIDGGCFRNYIFNTHNSYTYYSAIEVDGFKQINKSNAESTTGKTAIFDSTAKMTLSGADVTNANSAEFTQLRAFAQQGSNLAALGWDLNDISTWTGITWSDAAENRVQTIDLGFKNLTGALNLSGFSGLQNLNCAGNQLAAIDFSGCSSLTEADVSHNNLTGISLDDCALLEKLECSWNQIASLDIGSCAALKYLYCEYNNLSTVNVSNNTNLIEFYCGRNNLTQLDVTANTALNTLGCDNNYLDIQDGSAVMTEIQNIMTRDGAWVNYTPQKVPAAAIFNASDIAKLTAFANTDTNKDKLGWDLAVPKDWVCVEWVQKGTEYRVKELHIESFGLTGSIDLSGMTSLTSLSCEENALTGLNLNGCTSLQYLTCNNSQLQNLNITNCAAITKLTCEDNYLDVSAGTALRTSIDSLAVSGSEFIVFEPQMIFAEVSAFNAAEYSTLSAFAQTGDNLTLLGWDINKPGEWSGIEWDFINGGYKVQGISLQGLQVAGTLNLTDFGNLNNINFRSTKITSIILPNGITEIPSYTFYDCSELESVNMPGSIVCIGNNAFNNCTNLVIDSLPVSLNVISDNVFYNCTNLNTIIIPASVNSIGTGVFSFCSGLEEINVEDNNQYYSSENGVLFDKDKISLLLCPLSKIGSYEIPNSVNNIENSAFSGCSSLSNINMSANIIRIGILAFSGCSAITSLTMPKSVANINMFAFSGCENLVINCLKGSPAETYAIKNGLSFANPDIESVIGTKTVVDNVNGFICGLSTAPTSLDGLIQTIGGATIQIINSGGTVCGTDSTLNILFYGDIVKSYKLVIYGDVNGDGNIDTNDSDMIVDIGNYALPQWDPVTDAAYIKACDLFRDGVIDENDCAVLTDVQNFALTLDQRTGVAT